MRATAITLHGESTTLRAGGGPAPGGRAPLRWRVQHQLPNRTRFRLTSLARARTAAGAVELVAEAIEGVHHARFTPETGSLLVVHDGKDATRARLRRAIEQACLDDASTGSARELRRGDWAPPPARNGVVGVAVLSFLMEVLPPAPRAAIKLARSLLSDEPPCRACGR